MPSFHFPTECEHIINGHGGKISGDGPCNGNNTGIALPEYSNEVTGRGYTYFSQVLFENQWRNHCRIINGSDPAGQISAVG